ESSMSRGEQGGVALERLRELGVRVSIDDFGTGYSSLSRIAELPIDMIKIPKTFIDRLAGNDTSVVDAILRLAGSLGLTTVAEGIEHISQARRVRELGCELGQGYLFSKPLPAEQVIDLLRAQRVVPGPSATSRSVPAAEAIRPAAVA